MAHFNQGRCYYYLIAKNRNSGMKTGPDLIPFRSDKFILGRGSEASVKIPDPSISRKHGLFMKKTGAWTVKNLSSQGMIINGESLPPEEECFLDVGDELILGNERSPFVYKFKMKTFGENKSAPHYLQSSLVADKNASIQTRLSQNAELMNRLLQEKSQLCVKLKTEKRELENEYNALKEQLVQNCRQGIMAQNLVEEERKRLQLMENEILLLQQQSEKEKVLLQERLRQEEEARLTILEDKDALIRQMKEDIQSRENERDESLIKERELRYEKEALMRNLEDVEASRQALWQLLAMKKEYDKEVQEQKAKQLEETRRLEAEKAELVQRLATIETTLEDKVLVNCVLESELQAKLEALKDLVTVTETYEKELQKARLMEEQVTNLQLTVNKLESQKASLEQECTSLSAIQDNARQQVVESVSTVVESEFQCPICNELFVLPVMLNCSHTFCKFCITNWKKTKRECPSCRTPITSETRSLVVENFIDKIIQTLSPSVKEERKKVVDERKEAEAAMRRAEAEKQKAAAERRNSYRGRGQRRNTYRQQHRGFYNQRRNQSGHPTAFVDAAGSSTSATADTSWPTRNSSSNSRQYGRQSAHPNYISGFFTNIFGYSPSSDRYVHSRHTPRQRTNGSDIHNFP